MKDKKGGKHKTVSEVGSTAASTSSVGPADSGVGQPLSQLQGPPGILGFIGMLQEDEAEALDASWIMSLEHVDPTLSTSALLRDMSPKTSAPVRGPPRRD